MENLALSIDIGGTNCVFGIVKKNGEVIYMNNVDTNLFTHSIQFIEHIYNNNKIKIYLDRIIGIGIGAPNGNHFTGEIQFAPNLPWENGIIPIKKYFENIFKIPTTLTNDANAAADGEKLFGAAKKFKNFIEITLGTGLGSGIYINNKILYGAHGLAGELGHIRVIHNGRKCKCGRKGCLETYTSSTGIITSYYELRNSFIGKTSLDNIESINAKDIFDHAINGDQFAKELVDYTAKILGNALADYAAFSDPEAFILFGGIAQSGEYFREQVNNYFDQNVLSIYKKNIKILISALHNKNAAILGNAASVFTNYDK